MSARAWIVCGALVGGAGVALGAIGAHVLEERLESFPNGKGPATYETAVRYQMYHAAALALAGFVMLRRRSRAAGIAGWCFLFGTLLFSGMLYAWLLGGPTWLVHVVPFGGLAMIAG